MSEATKGYSRIARKITAALFAAQSLVSAAFLVSGTVSAIAGAELSVNPAWAGVPSAVQRLGTAFAALAVSMALDRIGRRWGLALGLLAGVMGAGLAVRAIVAGSFSLFLGGLVLMGAAPSGRWAVQAGMNLLAGPFAAALVILALVSLGVLFWLRPDPRDVGKKIAEMYPETVAHLGPTRSLSRILRTPGVFVAVSAMVVAQTVMGMVMVITSLYMKTHGHALTDISLVISAHMLGMYAFSLFSGRLTDRWGRGPVILVGAAMLVLACLLTRMPPSVLPLAICLFLLGLGWNLCYVGGSTLLSDHLSHAERSRTQGVNDLLVGLASAVASFAGGLVFAGGGYVTLGVVGAVLSLLPLGLTAWWMLAKRKRAKDLPPECVQTAGVNPCPLPSFVV
jgi:predicted MFS family arabinose efflux permease